MELLVDRDIAFAESAFSSFGKVRLFAGRELNNADLKDAEVLLVRSVTRVDEALLKGSNVRFVGTTTAGTDHVDSAWLAQNQIEFHSAPGCNARAVAEHVVCCIAAFAAEQGKASTDLSVGIIGYGHVGSSLGRLLSALGIKHWVNDPPLHSQMGDVAIAELDELLHCDVITLHVPLTFDGPHSSANLLDAERIARLKPGALLINAARGGVVDETALLERITKRKDIYAAIDCWDGEPLANPALLEAVWHGSTHIAGHTIEARVNAVVMQQSAVGEWLGQAHRGALELPENVVSLNADESTRLADLLAQVHPLHDHTQRMRQLAVLSDRSRGGQFDHIRRQHGLRREFASYRLTSDRLDAATAAQAEILGFASLAMAAKQAGQ